MLSLKILFVSLVVDYIDRSINI